MTLVYPCLKVVVEPEGHAVEGRVGISLEQAAGLAQPCGPAVMCGVCGWRRGLLRTPQMKNHLANVSSAKQREFYPVWSQSGVARGSKRGLRAAHRMIAR